jgi:hypothetical protein
MAALWRVVDHVIPGSFGMFSLQSLCFLIGSNLLLRRYCSPIVAAWLAVLLLWFPPVSAPLAVIWKDSQMIGYLVLGIALLLSERRSVRVMALVVLLVASAMRHNAFTFTFAPIVFLWVWSDRHSALRRYASAIAVWLLISVAAQLANMKLTDTQTHPWHGSLALFDIVGTLRYAGSLTDAEIRGDLEGAPLLQTEDLKKKIRVAYSPVDGVFSILNLHLVRQPTTADERDAIERAWKLVVFRYPGAYLKHRWLAFRELLALSQDARQQVWVGIDGTGADLVHRGSNRIQRFLQHQALRFGESWLMRPYFYLFLIIALLPFAVRAKQRLPIALAVAAIASEAALFFLSPTPDYRYSIWLVPCSFFLVVMLVSARVRGSVLASRSHHEPVDQVG